MIRNLDWPRRASIHLKGISETENRENEGERIGKEIIITKISCEFERIHTRLYHSEISETVHKEKTLNISP